MYFKTVEVRPLDSAFLEERITKTKALIELYEDASAALGAGVQSYTIDTGQTRNTVTKLDLGDITKTIDSLYNRLATLEARLTGSGTVNARPGW